MKDFVLYCFMPRDGALDDLGFYLDKVRRIEYKILMNDENYDLELLQYCPASVYEEF